VYLLAVEMWNLLRRLSRLPVASESYEEKVREIMSKGVEEKQIIEFIKRERGRVESLLRRLEMEGLKVEDILHGIRDQRFKSLDELEELAKEARRVKPRVSMNCLAEKGEGKVIITIENPAPLPIEATITLEGAIPLKPAAALRINPRATNSIEQSPHAGLLPQSARQPGGCLRSR